MAARKAAWTSAAGIARGSPAVAGPAGQGAAIALGWPEVVGPASVE